jgi:primosomal protein N' (replication factor Y)
MVCKKCGSGDLVSKGRPGLEKAKEDLERIFPAARIALMSADTMSSEESMREFFHGVESGEVDIIVGTQIATKGFTFVKLKLVVALNVNIDEVQGDLRVFERTYQLLVQVAGRAGRFGGDSRMIIQTDGPNNPVLQSIVSKIDDHFYKEEVLRRKMGKLPPFVKQIAIVISGEKEVAVLEHVKALFGGIKEGLRQERYSGIKVLGPAENSIYRMKTKYRHHMLLQGSSHSRMTGLISEFVSKISKPSGVMVKVDVDPMNSL